MKKLEIKYIAKSVPLHADKKTKVSWLLDESRDFWLLRGITFDVTQGEAVGVIGENGSGKTELLKIITGLERQSTGFVTTDAKISYAGLDSIDPNLTGLENIRNAIEDSGVDKFKGDHLTNGIIDFTEAGQLLYRPVREYSVGMHARLVLGLALYIKPELVVIDDVLSMLDQTFFEKTIKRIQKLKDTGTTFIISDVKNIVIESLCERCAWISFGELQDFGPTKDIIRQFEYSLEWYRSLTLPEKNDYLANKQREQMMFDVRVLYDEFKSEQFKNGYTRKDEPKMRRAFYVDHGADPVSETGRKLNQEQKKPRKLGIAVPVVAFLILVFASGGWLVHRHMTKETAQKEAVSLKSVNKSSLKKPQNPLKDWQRSSQKKKPKQNRRARPKQNRRARPRQNRKVRPKQNRKARPKQNRRAGQKRKHKR